MALYDIDITCSTSYATVHSLSERMNICWGTSHVFDSYYQEITLDGRQFGIVTYDDKLIFSITAYYTEQSEHNPIGVVRYFDKNGNLVEEITKSSKRFTLTVSDTPSKPIKTSAKLGGARKLISLWEVAA